MLLWFKWSGRKWDFCIWSQLGFRLQEFYLMLPRVSSNHRCFQTDGRDQCMIDSGNYQSVRFRPTPFGRDSTAPLKCLSTEAWKSDLVFHKQHENTIDFFSSYHFTFSFVLREKEPQKEGVCFRNVESLLLILAPAASKCKKN